MLLDRVSIVVVTYKGDDVLSKCLESVHETCGDEPQIVVVDNSPSTATHEIVCGYPNAVYVESPGNPGFAGGNNLAMPYCDRDYVLLLNNDTVVRSRRSIEELVEFIKSHPTCGVAQGSIILPNADGKAGGCGAFLTPFGFIYTQGFIEPVNEAVFGVAHRCFSAMGAFMMFPRSLLDDVGFLFYDHFKSYYEEVDFCHRVWLAGHEVWYVPTVPIEHLCGYTAGKLDRTSVMRQYIRNSFFSLNVNMGIIGHLTIIPCYSLIVAVHACMHFLRGDTVTFRMEFGIFAEICRLRVEIAMCRRHLKRRVSDRRLLFSVVRFPPIGYLVRAVRGNI